MGQLMENCSSLKQRLDFRGEWRLCSNCFGLGSNQVEKAIVVEHNVEPYHVDEHKNKVGDKTEEQRI